MPDIVTIGEILVEIMADRKGQSFLEPGVFHGPFPSGAPAIFTDQVARMGTSCGIISRVGDDPFGELNLRRLKEDGADVSHVVIDPERLTGIAFVTYHLDGGREFIYHFKDSAVGRVEFSEDDENYLSSAQYLHVMGCSLLAAPQIARAIAKGVEAAKRRGLKLSFDPNIRPELLKNEETKKIFRSILSRADLILTGLSELKLITGCAEEKEAVRKLLVTARIVVVKNGSGTTRVYTEKNQFSVEPYPAAEVDPTGAGDCFDGAFLAALVQGEQLEKAAEIGCAAGALAVGKRGPMEGAGFHSEIEKMVNSR